MDGLDLEAEWIETEVGVTGLVSVPTCANALRLHLREWQTVGLKFQAHSFFHYSPGLCSFHSDAHSLLHPIHSSIHNQKFLELIIEAKSSRPTSLASQQLRCDTNGGYGSTFMVGVSVARRSNLKGRLHTRI